MPTTSLRRPEQGTSRVRLGQRLQVSVASTENSFEIILFGGISGVLAFAEIVRRLSRARNEFWQSEKSKWEARTVKKDFEERERAGQHILPAERRQYAQAILTDRFGRIRRSRHISIVEVDVAETGIIVSDDVGRPNKLPGAPEE